MINKLLKSIFSRDESRSLSFHEKFRHFQALLSANNEALKFMSELSEMIVLGKPFSKGYANSLYRGLMQNTKEMTVSLVLMSNGKYIRLLDKLEELNKIFECILSPRNRCPEGWDCDDYDCHVCRKIKKVNEDIPYYYNISQIDDSLYLEVGSKMSRLGEIKNSLGLSVPEGFCITARLFDEFINQSGLRKEIDNILSTINFEDIDQIQTGGRLIQEMIIDMPIPDSLENLILQACDSAFPNKNTRLAVRSSALGEDSLRHSFAGLHRSELNIVRDNLVDACWEVLLSKYSPESIVYRYISGLRDEDMPMSVGCIEMVDSAAGGVMFTRDAVMDTDDFIIQAVRGLGTLVVQGEVSPQEYIIDRESFTVIRFKPGSQSYIESLKNTGGIEKRHLAAKQRDLPCVSAETLKELCSAALKIENHFGCPLDIEWSVDQEGKLYILQARPLKNEDNTFAQSQSSTIAVPDTSAHKILINRGDCASSGIAAGTVFQLNNPKNIKDFPKNAIIVARKNLPEFARILHKAAAVITDTGSTTGHLSIIARELNVPVLTNTAIATEVLTDGMEITLDAGSFRVYEGIVGKLLELKARQSGGSEDSFRSSPLYRIWHRLTRFIFKLNLTDPNSELFNPDNCRTLHDIIRLAHEASMKEMFSLYENARETAGMTHRLKFNVPIDLYVIDLGQGLKKHRNNNNVWVEPGDIASKPFVALIAGMTTPGVQWSGPLSMDLKGFVSIMMTNVTDSQKGDRDIGSRSYSLISENYLNFFSRLGYHFSRLDAFAGSETNSNYITFNFRGGAADPVRRSRRVRVIRQILEHYNFSTTTNHDNITGTIRKIPEETALYLISEIGRLMGAVRNTDVTMISDDYMDLFVKAFIEGDPAPAAMFDKLR